MAGGSAGGITLAAHGAARLHSLHLMPLEPAHGPSLSVFQIDGVHLRPSILYASYHDKKSSCICRSTPFHTYSVNSHHQHHNDTTVPLRAQCKHAHIRRFDVSRYGASPRFDSAPISTMWPPHLVGRGPTLRSPRIGCSRRMLPP